MKKIVFFTIVFIVSVNILLFSQTAVSVPDNFIGTWWYDASKDTDMPDGVQGLISCEIKRDGTLVMRLKFKAYNQNGLQLFKEKEWANPNVMIQASGYVTAATSVEIVLKRVVGEIWEFDRFFSDGKDIVASSSKGRFTKNEPQAPKQ